MIKVSIVAGAFFFIYQKIVSDDKISYADLMLVIKQKILTNYTTVIVLISFTFLNWFFDILKWKTLVSSIQNITLKQAAIQSLAAHTASLLTPNRIGEYGVKALFYKKGLRKKIVLLNLTNHFLQMFVTTLFGSIGIYYLTQNFYFELPLISLRKTSYLITVCIIFVLTGRIVIHKKIRNFYWKKIVNFIKNLPAKTILLSLLFSVLKYFVFVHQFIYLLYLFDVNIAYQQTLLLLFAFYFIASIIPSLPIFDWIIKGSVAIMVLQLIGINEVIAISITSIMWLLNFALPAIIGSYFVLNYQKQDYIYKKNKND